MALYVCSCQLLYLSFYFLSYVLCMYWYILITFCGNMLNKLPVIIMVIIVQFRIHHVQCFSVHNVSPCCVCVTGNTLPCDAGYICISGSNTPRPTDDIIGFICPLGHFCVEGAITAQPCHKGYYGPQTALGESHTHLRLVTLVLLMVYPGS